MHRGLTVVVVGLAVLGAAPASAAIYTWNRPNPADWTLSTNWTPTRTTPATTDTMVIDGAVTPAPTVRAVPTETIRRLRFINGVNAQIETDGTRTLTLSGAASPNLEIQAGTIVTMAGSNGRPLTLALASSATASISGQLVFTSNAHRLLGAVTDGIVFNAGASFRLATGFTGSAFGNTGSANLVLFAAGSKYIHEAGSPPFGLTQPATKVRFNDGSEAIFRNAGGFEAAGRTYANLSLEGAVVSTSGTASFQFDTLRIELGSGLTHAGSSTASIIVRGDIIRNRSGALSLTAGSGGVQFNGGRVQKIRGDSTVTVTLGSAASIANGTTLELFRALQFTIGTMSVNGVFALRDSGSVSGPTNFSYSSTGVLRFQDAVAVETVASGSIFWPTSAAPTTVDVQGLGISMTAARTVATLLDVSGPITGANQLTVNGTLRRRTAGALTGSPTYGASSTLAYLNGVTPGNEWGTGTSVGVGVPRNVVIDTGAETVTLPGAARTVPGDLTITTGTLAMDVAGDLLVGGNWSNSGSFVANGRAVTFNGSAVQTLTRVGGETLAYLTVAKTGGSLGLASDLAVLAPAGGNALAFDGTTDVLNLNGRNLALFGAIGGSNASGQLSGSATSGLRLVGTASAGTLRFASGARTLDSLRVELTGASVALGTPLTVGQALFLTEGQVTTGVDSLILGSGGAVLRTNGRVSGRLTRTIPTGSATQRFDIGTSTVYAPIDVDLSGVTTGGTLTATSTDGDHPSISTSGLVLTNNVARYHSLRATGIVFGSASATFHFVAGDVDAGATPGSFVVRRGSAGVWNAPAVGARTSTSTQATALTAFGDFALGEPTLYTITASAGANGSISPSGAVQVEDRTNPVFTITPDPGYAIQNVTVDGASVGAVGSYTFINVTASHTIDASFVATEYTVTVFVNGLGSVTKSPDQATYPYHSGLTLTAVPEVGWEFINWTSDVRVPLNPVGFPVDSNMTVTANFQRKSLNYTRSTFNATYFSLNEATGATRVLTSADDSTRSVPLPFRFVFSGIPYDSTNYLAINANGFVTPSRTPVTQSLAFLANNTNMNTLTPPNGLLAPWYDNLSVGAVGTNPNGSVLVQTFSAPGSGRTFTVQWTNVSAYANTTGGQPRRINFQLVLFENTNIIEFRYGPMSGSTTSTLESASIGFEDSLGGNNQYLDATTGSRVTNNGMLTTNKWPVRNYRFTPGTPTPMSGSYPVGAGQVYPSLSLAVSDLNHRGQSGPVEFAIAGGFVDTAATSGSNTFPILLGPVAGNSATNTITLRPFAGTATFRFRGTENGNCGNQVLTNAIGNTNEPILGIVGADHVTLRDLAFEGGALVDRGLLLLQSSASDGAQDNLLDGGTVTLERTNLSSIGVQQFVSSTPSGPEGTLSRNRYLNLNISNTYAGMSLAGSASILDEDCEIGVRPGGSSLIGGPGATDIGNNTVQTFGIRAVNQAGIKIHHVEVRSVAGTGAGAVDGISVENLGSSALSSGLCEVHHCEVHALRNTGISAGRVTGIKVVLTANASSESRIYDNFVYALNSSSTATTSRRLIGIHVQDGGGGAGAMHNVDFNSVRLQPTPADASNACFEAGTVSGPTLKVRNNVLANFTGAQSGGAKHYAWAAPALGIGPGGSISDHNVLHVNSLVNGFTGLQGGLDIASLLAWQSATSSDANSLPTNPQYTSIIDLHINPANPTPVESKGSTFGSTIPWASDDIDDEARNAVTPDIGADEGAFTALVNNDMAATAFVNPTAGGSVLAGASFTPQVTFTNTGVFDQTNVTVRLRFRGPQPATTIVYDQTTVLPSVVAGASVDATFPSTSLAPGGFFLMEATALLGGDQNTSNDQISALLDVAGPLSGTYDVSFANPAPFNSLTNAIARLNTVGVSGPVVFQLPDSAYGASEVFPINIASLAGASATNTFTLRPAAGKSPLINGSTTRALFVLDGADFVTIDGSNTVGGTTRNLTLLNVNPSQGSAVLWGQTNGANGATSNTIKNLVIIGASSNATLFGVGFGGSTISLNSLGAGNSGNTVDNNDIRAVQYGIYSAGASAASKNTGTVISGNTMAVPAPNHVGRGGILVRFEDGVVITRNLIVGVSTSADASVFGISLGMTVVASDAIAGDEVVNATVSRNAIRGVVSTHPNGLSTAGILVAPATSGINTIVNNMVSGVLSSALDPDFTAGILVGGGAGSTTRVYFNSVYLTGSRPGASAPAFALAIGGSNPVVDLRNNALVNATTGATVGDPYVLGLDYATYTNLTSDRNVFLNDSSRPFAVTGGLTNNGFGDIATLAAWRSATGKDAASQFADPLYVSGTDLHIGTSGSPTNNTGVQIATVTDDFDGQARLNPPDIGADEYGSVPLTTNVVGSGSVVRVPDAASYLLGSTVTLRAVPGVGYHFTAWSGDTTSTVDSLVVVMNAPRTYTATFAPDTYTLTTVASGNGTVTKTPNQANYTYGTVVTVRAVPNTGFHFTTWSGDTTATVDSLVITMTGNRNYTASFVTNTYPVNVATRGHGTVVKTPNQANYLHGQTMTLTATPNAGHSFVGWSGDTSGTTNPLTVVVTRARNITAQFTYEVNAAVNGNGSVAKVPNQVGYTPGQLVTLIATGATGYHLGTWTGDTTAVGDTLRLVADTTKAVTANFVINTYTLTANSAGNGTVTKTPNQATYDHGTVVTLRTTPSAGYHFVGWSGDTTASVDSLVLTMTKNRNVTATFAINTYTLTATSGGNGAVTRFPSQATYDHGTVVTVRTVSATGYHFDVWSDDTTTTVDSLVVTMTANRTYTANFVINSYVLDLGIRGGGVLERVPDLPFYDHGTMVTINTVPDPGHSFVGWSGDTTTTNPSITVAMTQARSYTAQFTYALATTVDSGGIVVKTPDQTSYAPGAVVKLKGVPSFGYHFGSWSGDTSTTVDSVVVTMNMDRSYDAHFLINEYTLTTNSSGNGSVIRTPDQATYPHGTLVEVQGASSFGYHFTSWGGDTSSTLNPLYIPVNRPRTVTASFALNTYALTTTVRGNGTIARNPDLPLYTHGTSVQLTANAIAPYTFQKWEGAVNSTSNPINVSMDAAKHVQAVFVTDSFTVQLVVNGNGNVVQNPVQPLYYKGTVVGVAATPAEGTQFMGWGGDLETFYNPVVFPVDSNMIVVATFASAPPPTMNITIVGNGTVTRNPDLPSYPINSIVALTATPGPDYFFDGWTGDVGATTVNPLGVPMDRDKNVTATFLPTFFTLTTQTVGGGTVDRLPDMTSYPRFSTTQITAVPDPSAHFLRWEGDTSATTNPMPLPMNRDRSVVAVFGYALTKVVTGQGGIFVSPARQYHAFGDTVHLRAIPGAGYMFAGWSGDASGSLGETSIVVTGPMSVTANYVLAQHALQVEVAGQGTVTQTPTLPGYAYGAEVILAAKPALGWKFVGWEDRGGDRERRSGAGTQSAFDTISETANPLILRIDGDRRVRAVFVINTYTATTTTRGRGIVLRVPNQPRYDHFTPLALTATPDAGHAFLGWSGDTTAAVGTLNLVMVRDRSLTAQFTYSIDATAVGSGSIAKSPNQVAYLPGAAVSLTATPGVGYHFVGWSGDTAAAGSPLDLIAQRNWTLTGTFVINTYTLNTTVVGNGTVTKSPDQATYDYGTIVTLHALAPVGHHFVGWSGDTTTTVDSLVVTLTSNRSYTATFAINTYTLATTTVGSGSVVKTPNQATYDHGTVVTLRAVPAVGFQFAGWSGDTTTTVDSLVVTATANRSYTATFTIKSYTLATTTVGSGTVTRTPDQPTYTHGTVVTIRTAPAIGYHFVGWSGDTATTADSLVVTMTSDRTYTATFAINLYTLTVNSEGSGSAARNPNLASYPHGTQVTLTSNPNPGHNFLYWSVDTLTSAPTLDITMTGNRTYLASFTVSIDVIVVGGGTVQKSPDLPLYEPFDIVTLTAVANAGQRFVGWEGDTVTAANVIEVLMDANKNFVAQFESAAIANAAPDAPIRIAVDPPTTPWTVGASATIAWQTAAIGGRVDVSLSRRGADGPFETLATGLSPAAGFRWTVTGPEAGDARLVVRLRTADGRETADTLRVMIIEPVRAFDLGPIAPNPMQARATIPFAIPREAHVRLSVVDIQGREIARLVDGMRSPGRYVETWDTRRGGRPTSPGVYFVRFEFPGQAIVRRVIVAP